MPKLPVKDVSLYVGVDPGASGGLALIWFSGQVTTVKMPATEADVWEWFTAIPKAAPIHACIEKVHAMPGNGVSGMFKFGQSFGALRMALTAASIPWEDVTPQAWQKSLAIPKRKKEESPTQWKNRLKGFAQRLFPNTQITLATADAVLIATYCKRKFEGGV